MISLCSNARKEILGAFTTVSVCSVIGMIFRAALYRPHTSSDSEVNATAVFTFAGFGAALGVVFVLLMYCTGTSFSGPPAPQNPAEQPALSIN